MGGCLWLTGLGGLMEIGGLIFVAVQLTRVQRRHLGSPAWLGSVRALWRRLTGRSGDVHLKSAVAAVSTDAAASLSVRKGPGETLESRVRALESNMAELERETGERFADTQQRLAVANRRVDELRSHVEKLRRDAEEARREELRESVALQWWGTGLFALGVVANFLGNAWSC